MLIALWSWGWAPIAKATRKPPSANEPLLISILTTGLQFLIGVNTNIGVIRFG